MNMASFPGLSTHFSGIKSLATGVGAACRRLPLKNQKSTEYKFSKFHPETIIVSRRNSSLQIPCLLLRCPRTTHNLSAGRNYELSYNDDSHTGNYWINLIRDAVRSLRSLLLFLIEQPSQLKHIEWPSFKSTLKTATLTLVLVALLIVALSSVDSGLSYLLALFLRKKA